MESEPKTPPCQSHSPVVPLCCPVPGQKKKAAPCPTLVAGFPRCH